MSRRVRLDALLVARGLAGSRGEARELVDAGRVTVGGAPARKPSAQVTESARLEVRALDRWASRGSEKLDGTLTRLGIEVAGRPALDAGASTGGFTDVLLRRGAASVVAVDVGYGQLDWRLRSDPRVTTLDRTNARHLRSEDVPGPPPEIVVADLSFISLALVLPALADVAASGADHVLLVKPQFEVGRARVGKGGVVRDPEAWREAIERVAGAAASSGLGLVAAVPSPIRGPAGNVEFFCHLRDDGGADPGRAAAAAIADVAGEDGDGASS